MHGYSKTLISFAICLSALAGYVDAIGFLQLGGYFVSFMSGNSTRLSVNLMTRDFSHAALIGEIIAMFVTGSITGSLVSHIGSPKRQSYIVLLWVTLLLTAATVLYGTGYAMAAIGLMAMAMGAENSVFQRRGEVVIGLTYMTGTLVKLGQRLAGTMLGEVGPFTWLPYLLLWLGLVSGGAMGVLLFKLVGLHSLWLAAFGSAVLTLIAGIKKIALPDNSG